MHIGISTLMMQRGKTGVAWLALTKAGFQCLQPLHEWSDAFAIVALEDEHPKIRSCNEQLLEIVRNVTVVPPLALSDKRYPV